MKANIETNTATIPRITKKQQVMGNLWKFRALYIMAVPGVLYFLIFKYIPLAGMAIAFQDYSLFKGIFDSPWVGFKHFAHFMQFPEFWQIFENTMLINIYALAFAFPAPIILALALNEVRHVIYKRVIQTVIYMPHFLSWVIIGGVFVNLLSPETGPVNYVIKLLGFKPIYFMADPEWARSIIVTSGIWRDMGWGTIIYLAAIAGINPGLYEAASIDGANRMRQVWTITLPCLMPTIMILLLLQIGHMLDLGFERVYVFMNGLNQPKADIFDTYIYRAGLLNAQFSYTTAVGMFKSVVGLTMLLIANKLSRKMTGNGLY